MIKIIIKVIILLSLCFILSFCDNNINKKKKEGNKIIEAIERYKKQNSKLPLSLFDIGIRETEDGPIYYQKENDSVYIVYFGDVLGESVIYNSIKGKWNK